LHDGIDTLPTFDGSGVLCALTDLYRAVTVKIPDIPVWQHPYQLIRRRFKLVGFLRGKRCAKLSLNTAGTPALLKVAGKFGTFPMETSDIPEQKLVKGKETACFQTIEYQGKQI